MNTGMTNRVTSLSFSHYNPEEYILDHESGMKLSSINKILLNLFNNDLYAYTILVGKMKGLWWKYWFADSTKSGYSAGDMVYANGVQEMQFLRKYWKSVQQIANYNVISNKLPDFNSKDDDIVTRYLNALGDYFHLGNKGLAGQIYISLKDGNKDAVPITTSWQPYLVTDEELQRREYQMSDLLEDAVRRHNIEYHAGLDKLDEADFGYEVDKDDGSIYNHDLGKYLPKVRVIDEEHDSWVNFVATPGSNKILGFGTEAFDFIHIVKPLGTAVHRLETWVRTDGHVSVRGYVPTSMLTELIPELGTIEYNQWKMGGTRRFGIRLDYQINNAISKLYFSKKTLDGIDSDVPSGVSLPKENAPTERSLIDTAPDTDTSFVASDVRLIRNFGIARSPALGVVLSKRVSPDASDVIYPSLGKPSTVYVGDWTWDGGQSVVFEVPSNTQNISFEIDGMMRTDDMDFSLYDIRILKQTATGEEETCNIRWVYDLILNYEYPKAVIEAAYAEGFEVEWAYPMLIRNIGGMMGKIEHCLLEYPTFVSFMQLRLLDITPLNTLLTQLRGNANGYTRETDPLGTPEFRKDATMLAALYGYIYNYVAENLRYGALHDCFAELLSGAVTIDQKRLVLIDKLKWFLRKKQIRRGTQTEQADIDAAASAWVAEIKEAIEVAENEMTSLVGTRDAMANKLSEAIAWLKKLHSRYVERRDLLFRSLDDLPNISSSSDEYQAELKKFKDKYMSNFREVYAYLEEVDNTLVSAADIEQKIHDYLQVEWLDETTKIYLNYQLSRLNDSMQRYKKMNLNICLGYDKYVLKWMEFFGISGSDPLNEGQVGYTISDLLYGTGGKRSLTTVKERLKGG